MPANIRKVKTKYEVYNPDTGKVYGTYPNRASALQQLRALYANIKDMDKK